MELETDDRGIVTFLPLTAWMVSIVQDKFVGLAVDYYATAEDAAAGKTSRIQLHIDDRWPARSAGPSNCAPTPLIERRST